jgi:Myb-like DNA-binding protein REB1
MSIAPELSSHSLTLDSSGKKKKRPHRELGQNAGDEDQHRRKEHKKHKKNKADATIANPTHPVVTTETSHASHKPKSKKKTHEAIATGSQIYDTSFTNPQASTSALLSTIVAAAAGTPDLSHQESVDVDIDSQATFTPYHQLQHPATHFASSHQPNHLMPPFSELTFGSNEDVLRALQDIDISKIANVLKTLEDAASAANIMLPSLGHLPTPQKTMALGQIPAPSNTIIANTSNSQRSSRPRVTPQQTQSDHAHLLANKWLSTGKLSELAKAEGLVYKKGKFSATEEQQVKAAVENYRLATGLTEEQMVEVIFAKNEKSKHNSFWSEITSAVAQRPIIAVYHYVRRSYHPLKLQGKWSPEEDALLRQAVMDLGQQWEKVSERVGRMSADCRDRYRNHIVNREIRVTGPWTKEEEEQLTRIVTKMTVGRGGDLDSDVFWGKVSQEMGGKRGRQQCRIKWTDALSKTVKNEGQRPRWGQQDAYILVHKIDSLEVNDDTEIDWKTLPDPAWNLWSAHSLQRRWLTMKRGVPNHENMTHQEIVDTLRSKKVALPLPPPPTSRRRKERKVTSAAAITEADLQRETLSASAEGNIVDQDEQQADSSCSDSDD